MYKVVCTGTEQYKVVLYYSIVRTNAALCHTKYILVSTWIPKLLLVCTLTNLVCTWYVLGTNWYIHGKTKIQICITLGFEPWISCIATSAQYHYATSVYSTVIHGVNTRYIPTENATRVARYLLAGVRCPARVPPRPRLRAST